MQEKRERNLAGSSLAAAALLASATGCAALGIIVTLSEAVPLLKDALNIYEPVGALAGKTTFGVVIWLVSWAFLAQYFRGRHVDLSRVSLLSYLLVMVGLLGTFPPIYWLVQS